MGEWINKQMYILCNGTLLSREKESFMHTATWTTNSQMPHARWKKLDTKGTTLPLI